MPELYARLTQRLTLPSDVCVVDFNARFKAFDETTDLFNDHVHLRPEGDQAVADIYCDVLTRRFFPMPGSCDSERESR